MVAEYPEALRMAGLLVSVDEQGGLSPCEGCSSGDTIHIWELAGQTPGHFEVTRWLVLMWDGNYFCDSNTGLHLGQSLVIRLTNIHALLHKWLLTLAGIVEAYTHAHIDKGKWDWPCYYGSSQGASQWECWSTLICHPLHLLTVFIPLFGNICKTLISPLSLPTSPGLDAAIS